MSSCSKRRRCSRYESYKVMVWSFSLWTELESSWRSQPGARDNGERGAKLRWTFPAVPDLLIGIIWMTSSHLREKAASPSVWFQRKEEFAGWRLRDTRNKIKNRHIRNPIQSPGWYRALLCYMWESNMTTMGMGTPKLKPQVQWWLLSWGWDHSPFCGIWSVPDNMEIMHTPAQSTKWKDHEQYVRISKKNPAFQSPIRGR